MQKSAISIYQPEYGFAEQLLMLKQGDRKNGSPENNNLNSQKKSNEEAVIAKEERKPKLLPSIDSLLCAAEMNIGFNSPLFSSPQKQPIEVFLLHSI
jgi:hypothetical protein